MSKLSVLIMSIYVLMSGYVGHLCYLADRMTKDNPKIRRKERSYLQRRANIGWFTAEHFLSLGLLGTIFGLTVATSTHLDAAAPLAQIVTGLKKGLNTAFYTTICGIICSLPLQVQLLVLGFKTEKKIEKEESGEENQASSE